MATRRGLQALFDQVSSTYAATDETHDDAKLGSVAEDKRRTGRGIEVGHIFYFGDKYSAAMGLKVSGRDGTPVTPMMGSYGVGVSRLVGAIIEASHDDAGIVWPEAVAPWRVGLVTMRADDEPSVAAAEALYEQLRERRRRDALRRPRRARRRQARLDGPDRPALAGDRRPARDRQRARSSSSAVQPASARSSASKAPCETDRMILNRAERMLARRYLLPRQGRGVHLPRRQHQPARGRARRRRADHRDERDERLPRRAVRQDRRPERPCRRPGL